METFLSNCAVNRTYKQKKTNFTISQQISTKMDSLVVTRFELIDNVND